MENVNVKDFIVEKDSLGGGSRGAKAEVSTVQYETVFVSGCDFALRKVSRRPPVLLVFLISQGQMYTKTGDDGPAEKLTADSLMRFCSCAPPSGLAIADEGGSVPTWITALKRNRSWCTKLLNALEGRRVMEYISAGLLSLEDLEAADSVPAMPAESISVKAVRSVFASAAASGADWNALRRGMYNACTYSRSFGNRTREYWLLRSLFHDCGTLTDHGTSYDVICSRWGVEGVHQLTRAFFTGPLEVFPCCRIIKSILFRSASAAFPNGRLSFMTDDLHLTGRTEFGLRSFIRYIFAECVRQGYSRNPEVFWSSWADILNMQLDCYGKITDKYPRHLATDERILSDTLTEIYMEKEHEGFSKIAGKYAGYEYESSGLMMVVPKTAEDIILESRQQCSCLSSYIGQIVKGSCMIFFVRRTAAPEKSLVTVQVMENGALGQVLGRNNSEPPADVRRFIAAWHTRFFEPDGELVGLP